MSDLELSKDQIYAIGRMVVAITRVESLILDLLRIALESRSVLNVVAAFSHQQVSSNIDTLKSHYTMGMNDDEIAADPVVKLLNQVRAVCDFRNTVVHAHWTIGEDGEPLAVRYHSRGKFTRSRRPSEEELRGGHTIREHVGKSHRFLMERVEREGFRIVERGDLFSGLSRSSFASLDAATRLVNATLARNRDAVDRVARGHLSIW
jgi:hypothetical protein